MGCVSCSRCGAITDLDYNVEDVVVMRNGMSHACYECLTVEEQEYADDHYGSLEAMSEAGRPETNA